MQSTPGGRAATQRPLSWENQSREEGRSLLVSELRWKGNLVFFVQVLPHSCPVGGARLWAGLQRSNEMLSVWARPAGDLLNCPQVS